MQSFILQQLPPCFCTSSRFWRSFSRVLFTSQVAKVSWSLLSFWTSADSSERAETVWKDPESWFTHSWVQIEQSSAKHSPKQSQPVIKPKNLLIHRAQVLSLLLLQLRSGDGFSHSGSGVWVKFTIQGWRELQLVGELKNGGYKLPLCSHKKLLTFSQLFQKPGKGTGEHPPC